MKSESISCATNTTSRRWSIALTSLVIFLCSCFLTTSQASAQTAHSVTLTWTASSDAAANPTLTYNVYRASGGCTGTPTFTKLAGAVTTNTYSDLGIAPGDYCYQVTALLNGAESVPSNAAPAVILPSAPASLTVVVK